MTRERAVLSDSAETQIRLLRNIADASEPRHVEQTCAMLAALWIVYWFSSKSRFTVKLLRGIWGVNTDDHPGLVAEAAY